MAYFNLVLTLVLMVVVAIVAAQNPTAVTLKFIALRSVELPLGLVMICSASLGALTVAIGSLFLRRQRPLSVAAQQIRSRLEALEQIDAAKPDPPPEAQS